MRKTFFPWSDEIFGSRVVKCLLFFCCCYVQPTVYVKVHPFSLRISLFFFSFFHEMVWHLQLSKCLSSECSLAMHTYLSGLAVAAFLVPWFVMLSSNVHKLFFAWLKGSLPISVPGLEETLWFVIWYLVTRMHKPLWDVNCLLSIVMA